ncbi:MAG: FAD-dependent oxidoreductase [Candidatus Lokiarchaeota archaeon]|nr:FAD-dependent oxidoreductase [Candidatus Lokiarchaeota archaeon]
MEEFKCEVLIIGGGPAGLSAGIYCARANRDVIILEGKELSALARTKEIQNWPGEIDIKGKHLLAKFRAHVESYSENVRIIKGDVISLMLGMGVNMTSTRTANITSDVVIIATGRGQRKEIIKGEGALLGYGVSYCALCDGPLYRDKVVYMYGNDEEMLEDALELQQMGCKVHIITNVGIEELPDIVYEVKDAGINVIENMEVIEAVPRSDGIIQKIIARTAKSESEEPKEIKEFDLNCLFILSHISSNSIFKKAGVEIDEKGNIKVDEEQKTILEGVFAAGDCTGGHFQVVFATAEGSRAGINAAKYLRQLKKE